MNKSYNNLDIELITIKLRSLFKCKSEAQSANILAL